MSRSSKERLEARGVAVAFGGIRALSGVDLSLKRGEILGLIGPNGAGKTTMVNVLSGFQRPTSGAIRLDDIDVSRLSARKIAQAGVARSFQAARLFRAMTVEQNLSVAAIGAGLARRPARERALGILDWMGLAGKADLRCDSLSYGDERRVSIARALALEPSFALLDEPASGMNDAECEALMELIARLPERFGCGVLLIEHNMKVIMGVCERIHVLDGGQSLAEGSPADIQMNPVVRRAYLGEKASDRTLAI
ncbi:ABC transporter ATP-binding protein [Shinella pollutisoli]|uniref:ABC transporter ATP-binding protein n=1 Tax=Shinella pollutisoli TaxID=2250594 RepID=A0ABV7DCQ4_9HYPH|nr:ABC transporter ATP-binding protein [Shinella pollutisoli]